MADGIRACYPDAEIDECPIADGGEGTVDTLVRATAGDFRTTRVDDPLGRPVDAAWGLLGGQDIPTAVIEVAAASGLTRLSAAERNPMRTSSFGTGQLMLAAAEAGAKRIMLGLGGSATTDGGGGIALALGIQFFDTEGKEFASFTGADLGRVHRIDAAQRQLRNVEIVICRDVDNPLTGPDGAAAIYGPQKGATPEQVNLLDQGLSQLSRLWLEQFGVDVRMQAGAGAAGGIGGGIVAMLGAETRPGIATILNVVGFQNRVKGATLCLTGEGQLDIQSLTGKACMGVAQLAQAQGVPTIAIVGRRDLKDDAALQKLGMCVVELSPGTAIEDSMHNAAQLLRDRTTAVVLGDT